MMTYLKLTGLSLGFLINWNVHLLREGITACCLSIMHRVPMRHHGRTSSRTLASRSSRLRGLLFARGQCERYFPSQAWSS